MNILEVLFKEKKPDIVSIAEHWCSPENVEAMTIPGYVQAGSYCRSNRLHGGSLIYVKEDMPTKKLSLSRYSEEMVFEVCGTIVEAKDCKYVVLSIYRPCSGDFASFVKHFSFTLNHVSKLGEIMLVCGDLNVDILKDGCPNRTLFLDLLECYNLHFSSVNPTRVFRNVNGHTFKSKIDYILTNINFPTSSVEVYEAHISDHRVLSLKFPVGFIPKQTLSHKLVRDLSPQNLDYFSNFINNCDFSFLYGSHDVDECFGAFMYLIEDSFQKMFPLIRSNNHTKYDKRWISPAIHLAKRNLDNCYWLYTNMKCQSTYDNYRRVKSSYNSLIKETKSRYFSNLIETSDNKNKTVWSIVNSQTNRTLKKYKPIELIIDGKSYVDPENLAVIFAKYFSSVTEKALHDYYNSNLSNTCTTSSILNFNFFFQPVLDNEVINVINNLKNNKCSGIDHISTRILKNIGPAIAPHFAHIINLSISSGVFPNLLKKAIVLPIYKKK